MDNKKKSDTDIVRSSAVEYLTFIAAHGDGGVEAIYADENIWLTQKMMGVLYKVENHTINYHLKKIFADSELQENSVIRNFRITASDGKNYATKHYNRIVYCYLPWVYTLGYSHCILSGFSAHNHEGGLI
jgi:hypothetical protein